MKTVNQQRKLLSCRYLYVGRVGEENSKKIQEEAQPFHPLLIITLLFYDERLIF